MTTMNAGAASSAPPETGLLTSDASDLSGTPEEAPLTAESLIEEVSIDGMCGVY